MIRVLQVVPFNNGMQGGIENLVMNMYRHIDRDSIQFDFLTYGDPAALENEIKDLGGRVYRLPSRRRGILNSRRETILFFNEHAKDYKIIHLHICSASNIMPLKYKGEIPISIVHSHASRVINPTPAFYPISYILHRINRRYIVKHADFMFACSRTAAVHMYGKKILSDPRYVFFHNGIETGRFKFDEPCRKKMRQMYHITEDEKIIGFVGRFEEVKNIPFLIHVFQTLVKTKPGKYKLVLVGNGSLLEKIRSLVIELNLQEKVILAGVQTDVVPFLQMMDVFVLTSKNEGFSIVTLEAEASGLPCICASTIPEEVNVCGKVEFVSLRASYKTWADIIEKTLGSDIDREGMAQKLIATHYDIEDVTKFISDFYQAC